MPARYDATRNQMERGDAGDAIVYTANGAITPVSGTHAIAKTSLAAMTLVAPPAGSDGMELTLIGRTAFAHTVTITAGLGGRGATHDVLTFGAVGDNITLRSDNGAWIPKGAPYGVTIG